MARICPSCGHENADDVDFCASCGGYVRWEPTRAAPAVQPPAPAPPPPAEAVPPPAEAAPPAAAPPPAPAAPQQAPPAAQQPPPAAPQAPPPAAQAPVAQPPAPAPQAQPASPAAAPQQQPAPPPEPEAEPGPKKRSWGRKKKVPGVAGGGVTGPKVRGPRIQAPRVNVGPGGVNVAAPKVSAPKVAPPRAKAPKLKQPKIPTTPKGLMKSLKKLPTGGGDGGKGGGASGAVTDGPVAPQPAETWHWDAVGHKSGRGKTVFFLLLLVLFAGAAAGAGWWFFVREDDSAAPAAAAAARPLTPKAFVNRLEPLLVRSARDRARISGAVTRVAACSLAPGPAGQQIGQTVAGRRAVLVQVRRLRPPAQLRNARRSLEQSLSLSAAAGRDYSVWVASFGGACPVRAGPEYAKAIATNRRAQASKIAFARLYNPIARSVGGRTWRSTQF